MDTFLDSEVSLHWCGKKGSTTAHDGSTTEEGVFFIPHLATNYCGGRALLLIRSCRLSSLDKFVKYYGVSYTGTGTDFGCKYSGKQVASLVRGNIMSIKGTPSPHQLRCRKINAGCASFVGCLEWRPPSGLLTVL